MIQSAELTINPETLEPMIRAVVVMPLSPVIEAMEDGDVAMKIGKDFIRDLNEIAETDRLITP